MSNRFEETVKKRVAKLSKVQRPAPVASVFTLRCQNPACRVELTKFSFWCDPCKKLLEAEVAKRRGA